MNPVATAGLVAQYRYIAVIQIDTAHSPPSMTSPGEILKKILKERGIGKTELGKLLGVGYLAVNRWTKDEHFNEDNQAKVIKALDLPPNRFSAEMERVQKERDAYRAAIFRQFAERDIGKTTTEEEWRDLNKLPERITVTVEYLQATVLAMRGLIPPKDVWRAVREQRKLLKQDAKPRAKKKPHTKG